MDSIAYSSLCFDLFCLQPFKNVKSIFALSAIQNLSLWSLETRLRGCPRDQAQAYLPLQRTPGSPEMELLEMLPQSDVTHRAHWIAWKVTEGLWWQERSCSHHPSPRARNPHSDGSYNPRRAIVPMHVVTFTSASRANSLNQFTK